MSTQQRMGKGLDALFGGAPKGASDTVTVTTLSVKDIVPNPSQPRRHFSPESLEELAASIRQQGIIQPLLVRPKPQSKLYEIVAGERRFRAATLAGLQELPVYVREMTDEEVMAAALIENIQRENLSPIEEALALQTLRDTYKITQEDLASRLGKSRSAIANALRLLQLNQTAQTDLQQGHINAGHARALLSVAYNEEAQELLRKTIKKENLTVREAEDAAQFFKENALFPWQEKYFFPKAEEKNTTDNEKKEAEKNVTHEGTIEKPATKRSKTPYIKNLQSKIKEHLALKASINGTEQKGRITLTYNNPEELEKLLSCMGVEKS